MVATRHILPGEELCWDYNCPRHQAVTAAARYLPEKEQEQLANLMSHSHATQHRYYQVTKSKQQSLLGFKALEGLYSSSSAGLPKKFMIEEVKGLLSQHGHIQQPIARNVHTFRQEGG